MSRFSMILLILTLFTLNLAAQTISGTVKNKKDAPMGGALADVIGVILTWIIVD